jgi:hypothetical protein
VWCGQYNERGRELYGDAWDKALVPGGMSLGEILAIPDQEVKELQRQAQEVVAGALSPLCGAVPVVVTLLPSSLVHGLS